MKGRDISVLLIFIFFITLSTVLVVSVDKYKRDEYNRHSKSNFADIKLKLLKLEGGSQKTEHSGYFMVFPIGGGGRATRIKTYIRVLVEESNGSDIYKIMDIPYTRVRFTVCSNERPYMVRRPRSADGVILCVPPEKMKQDVGDIFNFNGGYRER